PPAGPKDLWEARDRPGTARGEKIVKTSIPSGTRLERISVLTTAAIELSLYETAMELGVLTYVRTPGLQPESSGALVHVEMLVATAQADSLIAFVQRQRDTAGVTAFTADRQSVP